jgi:UTP:GlnB (protein PII) uridylyltransferase
LLVQAPDRPGLLLRLVRAMHRQGIEIVASEVRTEGAWIRDRFTLHDPGQVCLSVERREQVCEAVRRAAERV